MVIYKWFVRGGHWTWAAESCELKWRIEIYSALIAVCKNNSLPQKNQPWNESQRLPSFYVVVKPFKFSITRWSVSTTALQVHPSLLSSCIIFPLSVSHWIWREARVLLCISVKKEVTVPADVEDLPGNKQPGEFNSQKSCRNHSPLICTKWDWTPH